MLDDRDYKEIQRMARACSLSIAEWVRQAMSAARRRQALGEVATKLAAIRAAAANRYPTADIDVMLAQIGSGYDVPPRS